MSQERVPFVVANDGGQLPIGSATGHPGKHQHTPSSSPGSAEVVLSPTLMSSGRPERGKSAPVEMRHSKQSTAQASHRRQKFAGSPKVSIDEEDSSSGSPVHPSLSSPEMSPAASQDTKPVVSTSNGHAHTSAQSLPAGIGTGVAKTEPAADSVTGSEEDLGDVELRRKQRPLRHAQSDFPVAMSLLQQRRCSQSLADAKEHAYARLMAELSKAQRELQLKDEECDKLSKVRYQMEQELEDLTASLFEEANRMVQEANVKRMSSEKLLAEANQQIDVLQAEVAALKQLVLTSTPSTPNKHLHPQIAENSPKKEKSSKPFWKSHRRSTSHHEFTKESREQAEEAQQESCRLKETDTVCFDEFQRWKLQPTLDPSTAFLSRVLYEDIRPCLNFQNKRLAQRVQESVGQNSLTIEPIPGDSSYPRKCSLSETHKLCNYKIKLAEDEEWYSISQMCRNRIAAVCNFYTYIRYILQGLVKSSDKDMFQEIVRLRMQMAMARLGC